MLMAVLKRTLFTPKERMKVYLFCGMNMSKLAPCLKDFTSFEPIVAVSFNHGAVVPCGVFCWGGGKSLKNWVWLKIS